MKSWHIGNFNEVNLKEGTLVPREGEVKLKVSKVALSSTDMSCFANREDKHSVTVPAHAAVAYVTGDDEARGFKLGARVVVNPYIKTVEHGETVIKTMGVDTDGLLQDFVCVPAENVFHLPDGISDEEAVFAECIAMGNKVFSELSCDRGDYIVIVGAGTLGLILCQLAMYYQTVPILIDLDNEKLELARMWDICYALNPTYDNLERRVEEITGGRMSEAAVFTTEGVGLNSVLHLVKNGSEVVIAGYSTSEKHYVGSDFILRKQLQVKGVCNGYGEMPSAINLLANKIVKTNGIITSRETFDDVPKIFEECVKYPYQLNTVLVDVD
ncbi:MAG: zinc-binding dehydrogenase [Clostridia bacterium]|nr:zinc-binding dehydrogenase [Clostridia bacterium]